MYLLKVTAEFNAAHRLPDYNGKCRRNHGHRWVIIASWGFKTKLVKGMCYDLNHLEADLRDIVSTYDHDDLNKVMQCIPTAENIARIIYERLRARHSPVHREHLWNVEVFETPGCSATYSHVPDTCAGQWAAEEGQVTQPLMQIDGQGNVKPGATTDKDYQPLTAVEAKAKVDATLTVDKAQVGITEKTDEPTSE